MKLSLSERLRLAITNRARSNDNPTAAQHHKDDEDQLTRVLALVKAAKNITAGGTVAAMAIIHDEVGKALSDMEKNGDV